MSISHGAQPFVINVSDNDLELLEKKLELTRFPDEIDQAGWEYGAPLQDMRRLVKYWKNGYNWRKHEKDLNRELPQFTTHIQVESHGTLDVHYVHQKSSVADAVPLLFVHGCKYPSNAYRGAYLTSCFTTGPGSFIEVRKLLPILVQSSPGLPAFHVVAVSLPGYAFSEAPKTKGFEATQMAEVCHKVMLSLGYDEYGMLAVLIHM